MCFLLKFHKISFATQQQQKRIKTSNERRNLKNFVHFVQFVFEILCFEKLKLQLFYLNIYFLLMY